ncbi:MAG TPA: hypothetical protein VGW76_11055 [Pyrinomonadaceae bacterium]|nr:hypothetical protein [Pyrinomonadaceae bacterium]
MDRKRSRALLETYTSIAVLLVAIASLSSLAINYFGTQQPTILRPGLERGMVLAPIPTIDYGHSKQTLLIALNTNCSYCSESLPFYRKLVLANGLSNDSLHIVAVFPNKAEEVARYAKENDLLLDTITDLELSRFKISGTPTMILVNDSGEVNDFWIGKLPDTEADQLIRSLTSSDANN